MSIRSRNRSLTILFDFLKSNKASIREWEAYLELENVIKRNDLRLEKLVNRIEHMEIKLQKNLSNLESEH